MNFNWSLKKENINEFNIEEYIERVYSNSMSKGYYEFLIYIFDINKEYVIDKVSKALAYGVTKESINFLLDEKVINYFLKTTKKDESYKKYNKFLDSVINEEAKVNMNYYMIEETQGIYNKLDKKIQNEIKKFVLANNDEKENDVLYLKKELNDEEIGNLIKNINDENREIFLDKMINTNYLKNIKEDNLLNVLNNFLLDGDLSYFLLNNLFNKKYIKEKLEIIDVDKKIKLLKDNIDHKYLSLLIKGLKLSKSIDMKDIIDCPELLKEIEINNIKNIDNEKLKEIILENKLESVTNLNFWINNIKDEVDCKKYVDVLYGFEEDILTKSNVPDYFLQPEILLKSFKNLSPFIKYSNKAKTKIKNLLSNKKVFLLLINLNKNNLYRIEHLNFAINENFYNDIDVIKELLKNGYNNKINPEIYKDINICKEILEIKKEIKNINEEVWKNIDFTKEVMLRLDNKSIELKDLPLEKQLFLSNFNIKNYKQFMDIYIEKQLLTKEIKSQNDEIEAIKGKHKI